MFFSFFDWKIKLGIFLTATLLLCSVVSFIYAWTSPAPTDVSTALGRFITYRWFAFFIVSTFSMGGGTIGYHNKQLYRL